MAERAPKLAYPHHREALALAEQLREARTGGYWVAVGADPKVRRATLELLRRELKGGAVATVKLSARDPGPWRTLERKAGGAFAVLVELPRVPEKDGVARHPAGLLQRINVGREIAPARGWRVVLWTSLGRVDDLTTRMPDVWVYRRSVAWLPNRADFTDVARGGAVASAEVTYRARLREAESRLQWTSGQARLAALNDAADAAIELGGAARAQAYLKQAEALARHLEVVKPDLLALTVGNRLLHHPLAGAAGFARVVEAYAADPAWAGAVALGVLDRHRVEEAARRGAYAEALDAVERMRAVTPQDQRRRRAAFVDLADRCLERGRVRAARQMIALARAEGTGRPAPRTAELARVAWREGQVARAVGDTFEALVGLHRASEYFDRLDADATRSAIDREAAALYQQIGLRDDGRRMRGRPAGRDEASTRSLPDDGLLPLDRMGRLLDRAERALARRELAAAEASLDVAREAWAVGDPDFRSLYGLGRIRRLDAQLLVARGEVPAALDALRSALPEVDAEGLAHERLRLLVAIAALPAGEGIDPVRYDAARDALSLAARTRYVEEEIEALQRLSAAARALGRVTEARALAGRAAEIREEVGRKPPRAIEHRG